MFVRILFYATLIHLLTSNQIQWVSHESLLIIRIIFKSNFFIFFTFQNFFIFSFSIYLLFSFIFGLNHEEEILVGRRCFNTLAVKTNNESNTIRSLTAGVFWRFPPSLSFTKKKGIYQWKKCIQISCVGIAGPPRLDIIFDFGYYFVV